MRGNLKPPSAQVLQSDLQAQRKKKKRCVLGVCAAAGVVNQADDRHFDYRLLHNTRVVPHQCLQDPPLIFSTGPQLISRPNATGRNKPKDEQRDSLCEWPFKKVFAHCGFIAECTADALQPMGKGPIGHWWAQFPGVRDSTYVIQMNSALMARYVRC